MHQCPGCPYDRTEGKLAATTAAIPRGHDRHFDEADTGETMNTVRVHRSSGTAGSRHRPQAGSQEGGPAGRSALLAIVMSDLAGSATAAVPVFPDNLVVFPNRDFISAKGVPEHAGETLWSR